MSCLPNRATARMPLRKISWGEVVTTRRQLIYSPGRVPDEFVCKELSIDMSSVHDVFSSSLIDWA